MLLYCGNRFTCGICNIASTYAWKFYAAVFVESGQLFL